MHFIGDNGNGWEHYSQSNLSRCWLKRVKKQVKDKSFISWTSIGLLIIIFIMVKVSTTTAASGVLYESEPNNSYVQADATYDDYDNHGNVSSSDVSDWWRVVYSKCGNANFWLGSIPSGCNYDLYLYGSDGTSMLASSKNTGNTSELFSYPVLSGVNYYIKVVRVSGNSSSQYLMRTKNYPEVVLDMTYSAYYEVSAYATQLRYRMNCYGYAMNMYSLVGTNITSAYKQQPGEFIQDTQGFNDLEDWINDVLSDVSGTSNQVALYKLLSKISGDLNTMGGGAWSVQTTSATSQVPAGKRKIALVLKRSVEEDDYDYHFYVRHSNGTWSHKPGANQVKNKSFVTNVTITDNNIESVISENGYDDGVMYLFINKPFVIDYPHMDGQTANPLYTQLAFSDCAGAVIYKATQIGSSMFTPSRFDYAGDIDFFEIIPSSTKNYHITTTLSSSTYDTDIVLYDYAGNELASSVGAGNAGITYYFTADTKYYAKVLDANNSVTGYVFVFTG